MSLSTQAAPNYVFLGYLRRGLAASIKDGLNADGSVPLCVQLQVEVDLGGPSVSGGADGSTTGSTTVQLLGPADVLGVHQNQFIRSEPPDGTKDFEPNLLAGVEFIDPGFPWLFTPCGPDTTNNHLPPWVCLLVLKDEEFEPAGRGTPLPAIFITDPTALPPLSESWAWAHVQISGQLPQGSAGSPDLRALGNLLAKAPDSVLSRLLSPRALEPNAHYEAFLVPTFDATVQVGLGKPPPSTPTTGPAWDANSKPGLQLPYYYRFAFHTSDTGDFESLVRRLQPQDLASLPGAIIGGRPMDVSDPGPSWQIGSATSSGIVQLGGVLHPFGHAPPDWPDPTDKTASNFQRAVASLVQPVPAPTGSTLPPDPKLSPPLYGDGFAPGAADQLTKGTGWIPQLNLDPRWRGLAGVGAEVVQDRATLLLTAAWEQYPGLREANHLLRHSQFAYVVLDRMLSKHLKSLTAPESQLALTSTVHSQLRASVNITGSPAPITMTVQAALPLASISSPVLSPAFRRISRPLGAIQARMGTTLQTPPYAAIGRIVTVGAFVPGKLVLVPSPLLPPLGPLSSPSNAGV